MRQTNEDRVLTLMRALHRREQRASARLFERRDQAIGDGLDSTRILSLSSRVTPDPDTNARGRLVSFAAEKAARAARAGLGCHLFAVPEPDGSGA